MGKHICTDVSIYANVDKELKCNVVGPKGSLTINYEISVNLVKITNLGIFYQVIASILYARTIIGIIMRNEKLY